MWIRSSSFISIGVQKISCPHTRARRRGRRRGKDAGHLVVYLIPQENCITNLPYKDISIGGNQKLSFDAGVSSHAEQHCKEKSLESKGTYIPVTGGDGMLLIFFLQGGLSRASCGPYPKPQQMTFKRNNCISAILGYLGHGQTDLHLDALLLPFIYVWTSLFSFSVGLFWSLFISLLPCGQCWMMWDRYGVERIVRTNHK